MTRDEEARLGQLMMAKEKAWIKAGLRGPLPGDVRQYYYSKTPTNVLRLVRILQKRGQLDAAQITLAMQQQAHQVRSTLGKAIAMGLVKRTAPGRHKNWFYEAVT